MNKDLMAWARKRQYGYRVMRRPYSKPRLFEYGDDMFHGYHTHVCSEPSCQRRVEGSGTDRVHYVYGLHAPYGKIVDAEASLWEEAQELRKAQVILRPSWLRSIGRWVAGLW